MDINTAQIVLSLAIAVATFWIGRATKKHDEGKEAGEISTKLDYMAAGIDEVKDTQKAQGSKMEEQNLRNEIRLAKAEAAIKSAHKRIDVIVGQPERS